MSGDAGSRTGRPASRDASRDPLCEHREGEAVWITTPAWEAAGRALGLPDAQVVARLLQPTGHAIAPASGRAATRIEPLDGSAERLHVRRVLHGGWLAPLWAGRIAGLGRVREELRVTARLHAEGAPVPAPAFAVAQRAGPGWRAALCTVHIEDAIDGIRLLDAPETEFVRAAIAAGSAVRDLHDRGVRHADLHLGNLLVRRRHAGGYAAWVIDLDRARLGAPLSQRRRDRETQRLLRSLRKRIPDPTRIDAIVAAFLAGYAATEDRGVVDRPAAGQVQPDAEAAPPSAR